MVSYCVYFPELLVEAELVVVAAGEEGRGLLRWGELVLEGELGEGRVLGRGRVLQQKLFVEIGVFLVVVALGKLHDRPLFKL